MKFTDAIRLELYHPLQRKAVIPKLFNHDFKISEHIAQECRQCYQMSLSWEIDVYLDSAIDLDKCRKHAMAELNRLVYSGLHFELREARALLNFGDDEMAKQMLDKLISETSFSLNETEWEKK